MTFLVNSFWSNSSGLASFYATATGAQADITDAGNLHSSGNFVIPAAWNGRKVRAGVGQFFETNAANTIAALKGGSSFPGAGSHTSPQVTGNEEGGTAHSAPVVVSTGDTFTFSGIQNSGNGNWGYIELLPSGVRGCLANLTSAFATTAATFTSVNWNNEVYDDGSWHDTVTNRNRMTQPSGGTGLVRLQANLKLTAPGTETLARFRKNGAVITGYVSDTVGGTINIVSPPIASATGDFFEVQVSSTSATNVEVDNNSWFSIEELPSALKYAIASTNTARAIGTGANWTAWTANVEDADVGGWFAGPDTKFTVPAGVTRVRMGFFVASSNSLGSTWCAGMKKNGGNDFAGMPYAAQTNPSIEQLAAVSAIIDCAPGDTFEFYAKTSAGSMNVAGGSFCWIEEVPAVTS